MKNLFLLMAVCISASALAQAPTVKKWTYSNTTNMGLLLGSSDATYTAQTIHGLRKHNSFAGIGLGIDPYGVSGFPVVVHGEQGLGTRRSRPFVYGQSGVQLPWHSGEWNSKLGGLDAYKTKPGFVAEFGAGYRFRTTKKMQINVSIGYSYKNSWVSEAQYPWFSILPPPENSVTYQRYFYQFQRIALKAGISF